jgi:hypothetical protein
VNTSPVACTINNFNAVINSVSCKARVLVAVSFFHPSMIFMNKAWSLPLEWSLLRSSSRIVSSLDRNSRLGGLHLIYSNT